MEPRGKQEGNLPRRNAGPAGFALGPLRIQTSPLAPDPRFTLVGGVGRESQASPEFAPTCTLKGEGSEAPEGLWGIREH